MCCSICYEPTSHETRCRHSVCKQCIQRIYCCPICRKVLHVVQFTDDLKLWLGILFCSMIIVLGTLCIQIKVEQYYILVYIFGISASIASVHFLTDTQFPFPTPQRHEIL